MCLGNLESANLIITQVKNPLIRLALDLHPSQTIVPLLIHCPHRLAFPVRISAPPRIITPPNKVALQRREQAPNKTALRRSKASQMEAAQGKIAPLHSKATLTRMVLDKDLRPHSKAARAIQAMAQKRAILRKTPAPRNRVALRKVVHRRLCRKVIPNRVVTSLSKTVPNRRLDSVKAAVLPQFHLYLLCLTTRKLPPPTQATLLLRRLYLQSILRSLQQIIRLMSRFNLQTYRQAPHRIKLRLITQRLPKVLLSLMTITRT